MRRFSKSGLGATGLPSPGLHLRVAGFGAAVPGADAIVAALRDIPAFHLAGLREIEYAPEDAHTVGLGVQAAYLQEERRIRFFRLPPSGLFEHVLHHEIGHHVLALVLSSKVRSLWVNRHARRSAPASVYGACNPEEDFAESYARYLSPRRAVPTLALPTSGNFCVSWCFPATPGL
jgi:hypothetical protein